MLQFQVFQLLVRRWVVRAFGIEVANDKSERTFRFLEEALELGQANGTTQDQAHALVEYVYGRPVGCGRQEVGGVLLTLAGLCDAYGWKMHEEAAAEITRVNRPEVLEKVRLKQAAKKRDIPLSPLPGQVACGNYRRPEGVMGGPCLNCGKTQPEHVLGIRSADRVLGEWARRPLQEPALSQLRKEVADGGTHDCAEWVHDGKCQLCDRPVPATPPAMADTFTPPLREQPGGGKLPRTHTDAVGTDGGKVTISKPI